MTKKFDKQECFMKRGRGGIHEKPIIGGDCLKGGLGQFANLRGDLAGKRRVVFFMGGKGGDTPINTMSLKKNIL